MPTPTPAALKKYNDVNAYVRSHNVPITAALKKLNIGTNVYYKAKKGVEGTKVKSAPTKAKLAYDAINEAMKNDSSLSFAAAAELTGTKLSNYYAFKTRKARLKTESKIKKKAQKIAALGKVPEFEDIEIDASADEVKPKSKSVVIVCDTSDLKSVISGLL